MGSGRGAAIGLIPARRPSILISAHHSVVLFMGADPHPGEGMRLKAAECSIAIPDANRVTIMAATQTVEVKDGWPGSLSQSS